MLGLSPTQRPGSFWDSRKRAKVELDTLVVALISGDPGREGSGRVMVETLAQATGKAVGWVSTDKVQGRDPVSSVWGCV